MTESLAKVRAPLIGALLVKTLCIGGLGGCGSDDGVRIDIEGEPPQWLSEFNMVTWQEGRLEHHEDLIPYDLNTALFSDYALKSRAIYVPPDARITYRDEGAFDFPVGSAIVKSFLFPEDLRKPTQGLRLIETRVLLRRASGWDALPYIWNAEGTDAELKIGGKVEEISFVSYDGTSKTAVYTVPQKNQCAQCHERLDDRGSTFVTIIGPTARNLHRQNPAGSQNQLQEWHEREVLENLPSLAGIDPASVALDVDPHTAPFEELDRAARDYLDINCAHCHNPRGVHGVTSQLFLNWNNTNDFNLGICKRAGSAGTGGQVGEFDILPGHPDMSILMFRMETEEVGAMMPLIGRSLAHTEGNALIRAWISALPEATCN